MTNSIRLRVRSSRDSLSPKGPRRLANVPRFRWLLNLDNTGDAHQPDPAPAPNQAPGDNHLCHPSTDPAYPQNCNWPSVRYAVASPVLSEGTDADWNPNKALPVYNAISNRGLPNNCPTTTQPTKACKYVLSVMADGYQIGGVHFSVPMPVPGLVDVFLNPYPIPLGTIRIKVFDDSRPTDGTFDEQIESGLEGWQGLVTDFSGLVSADFFGNPICTEYAKDPKTGLTLIGADGRPTPLPPHDPPPPDPKTGYHNPTVPGRCLSDSNGDITIPNMAPSHYTTTVTPPDDSNTQWVQTTTLEGNHDHDVWLMPNDTGYDTELVAGGEAVPWVQFGFAHALTPPSTWTCPTGGIPGQTPGCGSIHGQLFGAIPYIPGIGGLPGVGGANGMSGTRLDKPIDRGWVALNSLNASTGDFDVMVATIPTQDPSRHGLLYPGCAPDQAGCFTFSNVPDGDYLATVWDEPQDTALDRFNVTISNGAVIDMGTLPLLGWFSHISGHVFIDTNNNGRMDPGEKGIFHAQVQNLNRTNNAMEGGINTSNTDDNGFYNFTEAYPLGLMSINQFFNTRYRTTGVTWQACNDPQEHTSLGPMVDVAYLPIIGHCGRLDWAVQPYNADAGENGGIVATLIEDEIRQHYNARQAQTYEYQTGIPGFAMEQYTPVKGAGPGGTDPMTGYALDGDGSYQTVQGIGKSPLVYYTEGNAPPGKCYPKDAAGKPIGYTADDPNSYDFMRYGGACVESASASTQFGLGTDYDPNNPATSNHGVQTVDGNYGLGNLNSVPAMNLGDTLVRAVVPKDRVLPPDSGTGLDRPLYRFTSEEDVNIFSGAQYVPQNAQNANVAWPPPAPPARQMPVGDYEENTHTSPSGPDPICAGATHSVHATNPDLLGHGGSALEGQTRHLCDVKLLNVQAGQSVAPNFHVHTSVDVPLPAHFWGYIFDDLSVETNRKSTNLGEVKGIPHVPVGVYDWTGRRMTSVDSDYNGTWEVLMPSADIFNCPSPAGTCPNVYRFVGNDPGQPAQPNPNFDPNYRTISANFQAWPNMLIPADTAPTRVVTGLEGPGVQFNSTSPCGLKVPEPQIFAVTPRPYTNAATETLTIRGANFGPTRGRVTFTPENHADQSIDLLTGTWNDTTITATVGTQLPGGRRMPFGAGLLTVTSAAVDPATKKNLTSTNGVTFHVIGGDYTPHIIEVGPGRQINPFSINQQTGKLVHPFAIQDALELAAQRWQSWGVQQVRRGRSVKDVANDRNEQYLVVVYPKWDSSGQRNTPFFPRGTYFENLIVHSPVKLQGIGPGGIYPNGTAVQGSVIDGRFFTSTVPGVVDQAPPPETGGDPPPVPDGTGVGAVEPDQFKDLAEPALQHWVEIIDRLEVSQYGTGFLPSQEGGGAGFQFPWSGVQEPLGEGAVVTVLGQTETYNTRGYNAGIDGFQISGGDQKDFPGNINEVSGGRTTRFPEGGMTDETAGALSIQGGAVYVNGGTDKYRITNNSIQQNAASYGAVRLGTLLQADARQLGGMTHNWDTVVSHNAFVANGGTNLAGALGIFDDAVRYSVDHNLFCMNASMEYGGAISHHGYSPNGAIRNNRIFFNAANDEGGAITIASEPAYTIINGDDLAVDPKGFTQGSGPVSIDHNYIASNLAQDDGGAIRILGAAGTKDLAAIDIKDNVITNNISAHEGGAISIFDSPLVNIVNNTIAKNLTTATAPTSNGSPAPAGISTGGNSAGLDRLLHGPQYANKVPSWMGSSWPGFSHPLIQNDIFYDNRAGSWTPSGVAGIGMAGDTTAINNWDVGSNDANVMVTVEHSLINTPANVPGQAYITGTGNVTGNPNFGSGFDTVLQVVQQRTYFRFRPAAIVAVDLPNDILGNYHLALASTASSAGINTAGGGIPTDDIDGSPRPRPPAAVDIGAHQLTPVPTAAPVPPGPAGVPAPGVVGNGAVGTGPGTPLPLGGPQAGPNGGGANGPAGPTGPAGPAAPPELPGGVTDQQAGAPLNGTGVAPATSPAGEIQAVAKATADRRPRSGRGLAEFLWRLLDGAGQLVRHWAGHR
jgi:hypothetical protein